VSIIKGSAWRCAQTAHQLQAVLARQADVDHREIERFDLQGRARGVGGSNHVGGETRAQQALANAVGDQGFVFDDEHPHAESVAGTRVADA